jgi:endonuclease III
MQAPVRAVAAILENRYGAYPDESGGPVLDQLVWFLLSTRTTVENCDAAYAALRERYPDWDSAALAAEREGEAVFYAPLRPAGLYRSRSRNLVAIFAALRDRFGRASLEAIREADDRECERFLLSLPGVGLKVARCVSSFGLGHRSFAVDTHIWRVSRRLGWHEGEGTSPTRAGADALQELVFRDLDAPSAVSLHVNLIRFGREFCPAGERDCAACPLAVPCPSASVPSRGAGA